MICPHAALKRLEMVDSQLESATRPTARSEPFLAIVVWKLLNPIRKLNTQHILYFI